MLELDKCNVSNYEKNDFVIHLTNKCNLSCEYCFMKGYHKDDSYYHDMDFDTFKKSIDLIAKTDPNKVRAVLFTGGEILTRKKEFLEQCARYAWEHLGGTNMGLGIQTNFTLMDDELLEMFKYYGFSISTSFDTHKLELDKRGFTEDQKNNIIDKLVKLNNSVGECGFIMVLNEDNIDSFPETWEYLDKLNLAQKFACLRVVENGSFEYKDMKSFSKKIIDIVYKISLKNNKIERLFEEDCGYMVEESTAREHHLCSCGDCTANSMTIYPDGSIATCFYDKKHPNWHYNNVHNMTSENDAFDLRDCDSYRELRKELHEITEKNCKNCPIFEPCEGPCWETQGTLDNGKPNKSHCNIRKYGLLYTYNFLMTMTEDEMYEYTPKMFDILNVERYDLDGLKSKLERNFKNTYLLLCEELNFDENIYK